jgi:magnesium and cobalt exporter, CNNM family
LDESSILIRVILLFFLIFLGAIFSGFETAALSFRRLVRVRISRRPGLRANLLYRLLENPRDLIISTNTGNEFVNILASSLAASLIIVSLGPEWKLANVLVMVPLLMLFGDITPKVLAVRFGDKLALLVAPVIYAWTIISFPLRFIVRLLANLAIRILIGKSEGLSDQLSDGEYLALVRLGTRSGSLDINEQEMISGVFRFGDRTVKELMTPRVTMFSLPLDMPLADMIKIIKSKRFSRVPIFSEREENIIGILHVKDLLRYTLKTQSTENISLEKLLRPVHFVPEYQSGRTLFWEMKKLKTHIALVVDEYGGIEGLVTMADLLEEIFGKIVDEFDLLADQYIIADNGGWIVSAQTTLLDFNNKTGAALENTFVETVGGHVMDAFGRLPEEGETQVIDGYRFEIVKRVGTRLVKLKVEKV